MKNFTNPENDSKMYKLSRTVGRCTKIDSGRNGLKIVSKSIFPAGKFWANFFHDLRQKIKKQGEMSGKWMSKAFNYHCVKMNGMLKLPVWFYAC